MVDFDAQFPTEGLDEGAPSGKQPPTSSRDAQNMRLRDPITGRFRGAQRCGLSKHVATQGGLGKIQDGLALNVDNKNLTYTAYSATGAQVKWSSRLPQKGGPYDVCCDEDGNSYWTDWPKAISKLNPSQQKLWTITPGLDDNLHEIRCVCTEPSGWVFCGVSHGGDQKKAKIFGYQQGNDGACDFVWSLQIGMYASQMKVTGGELYVLCEDKAFQRAYVRVYAAPTTAAPFLIREWRVPYPANGFDVAPDSKAVYTAHEPLTQRNEDSASIFSTSWWEDWTPKNLENVDKRLWCWLDASDLDGNGTNNSDYVDGEEVLLWSDKSGNARNLYRNQITTAERGPTIRKKALSGRDVLRFNGFDQSMSSDDSQSTSGANITWLSVDRAAQRSLIPVYPGAQFALFVMFRCDPEEAMQIVLGQDVGYTHDNNYFRGIFTNRAPSPWGATDLPVDLNGAKNRRRIGTVGWFAMGASPNYDNGTGPTKNHLCGFQGGSGMTLVSIIHIPGGRSILRVNGRTVEDWVGTDQWKGHDPTFVGWARGVNNTPGTATTISRFSGLMCEIVTLSDWYTQSDDPLANPVRETLISVPSFYGSTHIFDPDVTHTSELERMEGYFMHKWGASHKLPVGTFNALKCTNLPGDGDTVTINGRVYTFRNNPTLANEVHRGQETFDPGSGGNVTDYTMYGCLSNLHKAINLSGVDGVDYGAGTTANTDVVSLGVTEYGTGTVNVSFGGVARTFNLICLAIQTRSTSNASLACSTTGGMVTWDETTTFANTDSTHNILNTAKNIEHFAHRYYLTPIAVPGGSSPTSGTSTASLGGPPRSDNKVTRSPYCNLSSPYGMLARWDATSGRLSWTCVSNDNVNGVGVGGVGYGVRAANADNLVYSIGPRHTTISTSNVDVRCLKDTGDYYSLDSADGAWTLTLSYPTTFNKPRCDVDSKDNFYFPYFSTDYNYGAFVYTKTGVQLHSISLTNVDLARCIAHSPDHPDWGEDLNGTTQALKPRAEMVYIGARVENTCTVTFNSLPINGVDGLTLTRFDNTTVAYVDQVYLFVSTFGAGPADGVVEVKIGGSIAASINNLVAAINGTGTPGVEYETFDAATWVPSVHVRAENVTSTSMILRAIDPIQTVPTLFTQEAITVDESGVSMTISGSTTVGVNKYLTSQTACAYKVALVHAVLGTGSPRRLMEFIVADDTLKYLSTGAWTAVPKANVTPTADATFAQSSQYVQSTVLFQKVYFTNGDQVYVIDAKEQNPSAAELAATNAGPPPPRCRLIETWRGRLVMARAPDDAHNWHMSAVGDPQDWDTTPPVPTPTQAISGNNSLAGRVPDIINTIIPISDDLLLFGCDKSIWRLTGDPMAGGQLDLVTNSVGISFGRPYCIDSDGYLYFFGSRGGLFVMAPGGKPEKISDTKLPRSLLDIDLENYYARLIWNDTDNCVHIFIMPFGGGGTQVAHYAFDRSNKGFWRDYFGTAVDTSCQPTACWVSDGDATDDRVLVLGCEDGYTRRWDSTAYDDDGIPIDAKVTFGPYTLKSGYETRLHAFQTDLAIEQGSVQVEVYTSDTPDRMGDIEYSGEVPAGLSEWIHITARGQYFWIVLRNARVGSRFSFENMRFKMSVAGRSIVRG